MCNEEFDRNFSWQLFLLLACQPAFASWFEKAKTMLDNHYDTNYPDFRENGLAETLGFKKGRKYIKIFTTKDGKTPRSAWAFVDTTNGDILKAASWAAPAKGARGNIFDENNGMGRVDAYGPHYNR